MSERLDPLPQDVTDLIRELRQRVDALERRTYMAAGMTLENEDQTIELWSNETCTETIVYAPEYPPGPDDPLVQEVPCPRVRLRLGLLREDTGEWGLEVYDGGMALWAEGSDRSLVKFRATDGLTAGTQDLPVFLASGFGVGPQVTVSSGTYADVAYFRLGDTEAEGFRVQVASVGTAGISVDLRLVQENDVGGVTVMTDWVNGVGFDAERTGLTPDGRQWPYFVEGRIRPKSTFIGYPVVRLQARKSAGAPAGSATLEFDWNAQTLG